MSSSALATHQSDTRVPESQNITQCNGVRNLTFFDLPLELRQEVYRHIPIAFDAPIVIDSRIKHPELSILHVSRRLRIEASQYFFYDNAFMLWNSQFKGWKQVLGQESINHIRKLTFLQFHEKYYDSDFFDTLMQYKRVEVSLIIDFMVLLDRWCTGKLRGVHGFAVATASDLHYACPEHLLPVPCEEHYATRLTMLRDILNQFSSDCPGQCGNHWPSTQNGHTESKMLITFANCCYAQAVFK